MATCDTCGNSYDRAFTVTLHDGTSGTFDSFECAIHRMAPECANCGCRIVGHGHETKSDTDYCCAHCADADGAVLEG